jgi:alpha-beta hydrolase superfamily lysophospholipase
MTGFEEITLRLADGYTAYARLWRPESTPRGAVLYLHGIQSHCGWYEGSAKMLQQAGYVVLQPDRRGSGHNAADRGHAISAGQLIEDTMHAGEELCTLAGTSDYDMVGVSWGGRLACATYAASPERIRSLILSCPGLFPRVDVTPAEKFRIGLSMVSGGNRLYDIPLNDPGLFTSDPRWLRYLEGDDLRLMQVTASFFLATRRMDRAVRDLAQHPPCPLTVFLAGQDAIIDSPMTVNFVQELPWPAARVIEYADARHTLEFDGVVETYWQDLLKALRSTDAT